MPEKRRFERVPYKNELGLEKDKYNAFAGMAGLDLSAGGVRLRSEQFMPLDTPVRVRFTLNGDMVVLTGKVVWVQKEPYGEYYQLGVEFEGELENDFQLKQVRDFIEPDAQ